MEQRIIVTIAILFIGFVTLYLAASALHNLKRMSSDEFSEWRSLNDEAKHLFRVIEVTYGDVQRLSRDQEMEFLKPFADCESALHEVRTDLIEQPKPGMELDLSVIEARHRLLQIERSLDDLRSDLYATLCSERESCE